VVVRRWKAIVSLICLAIWLPATQHCQLEKLPGLAFLQCEADTHGQSGCEGDSCDTVEKDLYKCSGHRDVAELAILAAAFIHAPAIVSPEPVVPFVAELTLISSPPRPRCESWEWFSSRALAIRGPSLLS